MAPLVWGERETIDQMLWYTLMLLAGVLLYRWRSTTIATKSSAR